MTDEGARVGLSRQLYEIADQWTDQSVHWADPAVQAACLRCAAVCEEQARAALRADVDQLERLHEWYHAHDLQLRCLEGARRFIQTATTPPSVPKPRSER